MKKFIKKLLIFTAVLSVITCGINAIYMHNTINLGTMGSSKNDSAYITEVPQNIQICNFGTSHGYYGFNYENLDDEYTCFNFALPRQSLSYDYRILSNYRNNIAPGAVVYICLSYPSLFGEDETLAHDFEPRNKRYYHFLDDEYIKNYSLKTYIFVNYLPSLADNNIINFTETLVGLNETDKDWWAEATNSADAIEHGKSKYESLVPKKEESTGKRIINEGELEALYCMIDLCKELQATPILITTPYLSEFAAYAMEQSPDFFDDFYGIIADIQQETGVEYYDYSFDERFCNRYDYFFNTDHLNRTGALRFTEILLNTTL